MVRSVHGLIALCCGLSPFLARLLFLAGLPPSLFSGIRNRLAA